MVSFDHVNHEWLLKFIGHRVADDRMLRLIQKWLAAGVSEEGEWSETTVGTPQGAVVSQLLANVYLHYVFDLWAEVWREKVAIAIDVLLVSSQDNIVYTILCTPSRTGPSRPAHNFTLMSGTSISQRVIQVRWSLASLLNGSASSAPAILTALALSSGVEGFPPWASAGLAASARTKRTIWNFTTPSCNI